jgi:hypothetical protein
VPAVGVEDAQATWPAVPVFHDSGLSTVDSIDTVGGRAALVLLLAGGEHGDYGFKDTAKAGVVPPLDSVPEPPATTRG